MRWCSDWRPRTTGSGSCRNPRRHIPVGLNLAIAEARYPVTIRIDAHTELPPGYTARGVAELERVGAANLGGIMAAAGRPGFQDAVAKAYNSRLGLGGASYHADEAEPGPAESAYLGIMRTEAHPLDRRIRRVSASR